MFGESACDNLRVRDWTTALSDGDNFLRIDQILFPICEGASGRFKDPIDGDLVNVLNINRFSPGSYPIQVITDQGAFLTFTLNVLGLNECSIDQLGCRTLSVPVASLAYTVFARDLVNGNCNDIYEILDDQGIWRPFINISRDQVATRFFTIRHLASQAMCDARIDIVECSSVPTICRDTMDLFFVNNSVDSIQIQVQDYFEEQCQNSDYLLLMGIH